MITIIDYGMGNLRSVTNAFDAIGQKVHITSCADDLKKATAIVLPGVGSFGDGMRNLRAQNMIEALNEEVLIQGKPYLGICLGLQFLAQTSLEFGCHEGMGWVDGVVKKIDPKFEEFKVPHMGWNHLSLTKKEPLFLDLEDEPVFYFVHSYHLELNREACDIVSSTCWHGTTVTASVQYKNIYAVQFHPEKSQRAGLKVLENFAKII